MIRRLTDCLFILIAIFLLCYPIIPADTVAPIDDFSSDFKCVSHVQYQLDQGIDPILSCQASPGLTVTGMDWVHERAYEDGTFGPAEPIPVDRPRDYTFQNDNGNGTIWLQVVNGEENDCGRYTVTATLQDGTQRVGRVRLQTIPYFLFLLPKSYNVTLGGAVKIVANESGSTGARLTWFRNGEPFTGDGDRITLEPNWRNQENGQLSFTDAQYEDRAVYRCLAKNRVGEYSTETLLRVKNPLRWLWPLLGFIAAVLVVAGVVFGDEFYKKRRPNKLHADNSSDSLPMLDPEGTVAIDVPDMLARVTALGYPPSVIHAAVKWRAKTEASRQTRLLTAGGGRKSPTKSQVK